MIRPLLLLVLAVAPALAADPPRAAPPGITLADAEARLVERNLVVLAARRGIDVARAQRLVADTAPSPTLGYGQTVAQSNEGRRGGDLGGFRGVSPLNNLSVNLSVLVERGGKRELRTRAAELGIGVAEAQVLDALRTQVFTLRQAFFAGLQGRANLDVAVANRAALDRTEALLGRQVREGQIPEADLLRFQASRLPFAQDLATSAQAYAAASAQIAALLGEDATRAVPRGRDAAAGVLAPIPLELRGRLDAVRAGPLDREQIAEALPNRPDVLAATRTASVSEANARLAEAGRSRDVTLSGTVGRTELSQDLPEARRAVRANDTLSLGVSIPIFTRRVTEGNIAVAAAQQAQSELQARGALAGAQADLAIAWATYVQARSLLDITSGPVLRRAEEAYRSTEAAYAAGGRTLLDLLDALRTLNATRVAANAARAAYLTALAGLEQASGLGGLVPRM